MIEVRSLTKHYRSTTAVSDLSFDVPSGVITGFLGPNGAGKSTTMRMVMGLDRPDHGSATINGKNYHDIAHPLCEVGALLEAKSIHPGRSAYAHLLFLAQSNGIPTRRVNEVLELVGLDGVARRRAGKFSLGMGQRLGIAGALLGDPGVLLFDEPVNGLDPEGILWVRTLLKGLAKEGRSIFVSSHLMSEMALTADRLVVIGKGSLIAEGSVDDFIARSSGESTMVRSPRLPELRSVLERNGGVLEDAEDGVVVRGLSISRIGEIASEALITLHELSPRSASLEEAFMSMTRDSVEYHGHAGPPPLTQGQP